MFLIDSNSFITPYRQYYSFDFARSFWDQLEQNIDSGKIAILDIVLEEVLKGNDELKDWGAGLKPCLLYTSTAVDERTAKVADNPKVTVQFAETEDAQLIDKVLGMLLQVFSE